VGVSVLYFVLTEDSCLASPSASLLGRGVFFVRPRRWSIVYALALVALTLLLISGAWAQPKYKVLATIDGGLWSGLTFDSKGNLYGVTTGGGDYGVGSIFEMTRNSKGVWTVTTLHSFDGTDGSSPNGDLIFDAAGNLYGTTPDGGAYDGGTVFELSPGSSGALLLLRGARLPGRRRPVCWSGSGREWGPHRNRWRRPLLHGGCIRTDAGVKRLDVQCSL